MDQSENTGSILKGKRHYHHQLLVNTLDENAMKAVIIHSFNWILA